MTYSESPKESFYIQSEDYAKWDNTGKVGVILGFGAFAIAYVVTVIKIFIDIRKRYEFYSNKVAEDLETMKTLGMEKNMAEIQKDLTLRLQGREVEDAADDQLFGEAQKVTHDEFGQYL